MQMWTQIVPHAPGYTWVWDERFYRWDLRWTPVVNIYSPPVYWCQKRQLLVPTEAIPWIGRVIGRDGKYMKEITEKSGVQYIFFRDGFFEVWGNDLFKIDLALWHLDHHMGRVTRQMKTQKAKEQSALKVGL